MKLSENEMIKIIKDKKISACTDEEKKQIVINLDDEIIEKTKIK